MRLKVPAEWKFCLLSFNSLGSCATLGKLNVFQGLSQLVYALMADRVL